MFFVVDKPRLQRMIAIVREDRTPSRQGYNASFLRLKVTENELTVSGDSVSATFPATVYEQGVLFIRPTLFRRLVRTFRGEKFLTFQVSAAALGVDGPGRRAARPDGQGYPLSGGLAAGLAPAAGTGKDPTARRERAITRGR